MTTPAVGLPAWRRTVWASLPALTLGSAVPTAVIGLVLIAGRSPVLPVLPVLLLAAPLVGAGFAALQAQCCDVTAGIEPRTADWPRYLGLAWADGAAAFGLAGVAAAAFVTGLARWSAGSPLAWAPVVVSGPVLGLAVPVLVLLVPLRLLRPDLTRRSAAVFALHLTARRPVPVLGSLALVVLAVIGADQLSGSVLVLLPAPLALTSALAARRLLHDGGSEGVPRA